jgi:hypothetical protein
VYPLTPLSRSLTTGNNEFARQLAAHRAAQQPTKKFRSSAAPKGTKFGEGYTDRAKALREADESALEDERVRRLQALEQLAKEGHIDREEYVRQTKLLGGDISSTHLVKGLDFALLERVRRGENVMEGGKKEEEQPEQDEDLEEQLDKVLEKEVVTVERKKEKKQGEMAPPLAKAKTRAEILAELKRSRQAAKEAAQPSLGSKFKKIGEPRERVEETADGVKVKHVMGADGKVKRKVKRSDKEGKPKDETEPSAPAGRVMGMMPPPPLPGDKTPQVEEEEDDDIFAGAGDYDPLAGLGGDDDESDTDTEASKRQKQEETSKEAPPEGKEPSETPMPPPPQPLVNYFNESPAEEDSETYKPPTSAEDLLKSNPELAAALAKASKIASIPTKEESEREKRRKALMEAHERDSYDIDMGFGGSTNFGDDDEDEVFDKKGGGKKRKRGGGKKKGDKNSADVVSKIVEEKYGKS